MVYKRMQCQRIMHVNVNVIYLNHKLWAHPKSRQGIVCDLQVVGPGAAPSTAARVRQLVYGGVAVPIGAERVRLDLQFHSPNQLHADSHLHIGQWVMDGTGETSKRQSS